MFTLTHKKEMPFAIVGSGIAAGLAISTAAAATTAIGTAVAIAGAVAASAGFVMTVVGVATGDKELKKIGGYLSIAGGVAGAGAGLLEAGASAATSAAGGAATTASNVGVTPAATAAAEAATPAASQVAAAGGGAITPAFESGVGALPTAAEGAFNQAAGGALSQASQQAGEAALGSANAFPGMAETASKALETNAQNISNNPITQGAATFNGVQTPADTAAATVPANPADKPVGFFDFINNNKEIVKIGSDMFSGAATGIMNQNQANQARQFYQNQLDFEKAKYYGNMPSTLLTTSRDPTPAELAQYKRDQAKLAREQAKLITGR